MLIEDIFDSSPRVQTTDVDEATDVLSRVYLPVKLRPAGSNSLDMDLRAQELPMLTAGYLHFGTDVCISGDDVPAYYIEAPLSGTAVNVWRDGRLEKTAASSAAVFTRPVKQCSKGFQRAAAAVHPPYPGLPGCDDQAWHTSITDMAQHGAGTPSLPCLPVAAAPRQRGQSGSLDASLVGPRRPAGHAPRCRECGQADSAKCFCG
jgi:hypothetical protein